MQTNQEKEIERLRQENAALRAGAIASDPPLTIRHRPVHLGGQGCVGLYGLWKPTPKDTRTLQLYPNQLRRLRRDIDRAMQYAIDNVDELGWNKRKPEQQQQFIDFYEYLKNENLFRIH